MAKFNMDSLKTAGKLAVGGLVVLGVYTLYENIPGVPHIDIFDHPAPDGAAEMHSDTYQVVQQDIHCSDQVTADAGVEAQASYTPVFGISVGSIVENKLLPIKWLECGNDGISTAANVSYVNGKPTSVVVPLSNYHPTEAGVDDLSPI